MASVAALSGWGDNTGGQADATLSLAGTATVTMKPRLTEEEKLARECERRRKLEAERRTRIFAAKAKCSIDRETLDRQVEEARAKKEQEKEVDRALDQSELKSNTYFAQMEKLKVKAMREHARECKDFNAQQGTLQRETKRMEEFNSLHDPPARDGDFDPRCGVASLQRFCGEDLLGTERKRQQAAMQLNFIEQQTFEKNMLKRMEIEEDERCRREQQDMIDTRNALEDHGIAMKREERANIRRNNQLKAQEAADAKIMQKEHELRANEEEFSFLATDPFLNEVGVQRNSDGRVRRDGYKGSTREERAEVLQQQWWQIQDKEAARRGEKDSEHFYAQQAEWTRKQLNAAEREKARLQKAMAQQMVQENMRLHAEQKQRSKDLKDLYTNQPTEAYFAQFQTSSR